MKFVEIYNKLASTSYWQYFLSDIAYCTVCFTNIRNGLLLEVIGGANLAGLAITATTKTHKVTDLTGAGAFVLSAAACAWYVCYSIIVPTVYVQELHFPCCVSA